MDELNKLLPGQLTFPLMAREENYGYSDYYGAIRLAARYCGIKYTDSLFHFFWNHGCAPPWQNVHSSALTFGFSDLNAKYFVARKDQESFLKNSGFNHVHAIGMPIIYVPEENIQRKPRSLLIMPPHILPATDAPGSTFEEVYLKSIAEDLDAFSSIYACISPICLEKGMWTATFKRYGIKVISGASKDDSFALNRMATLFKFFETVTTPSFGSHVPYALHFGAKVSIWGDYQEAKKDFKRDATWRKIPEIAEKFLDPHWRKSMERGSFEKHYVSPSEALGDKELGRQFTGVESKRSPEELIELFQWNRRQSISSSSTSKYFQQLTNSKLGRKLAALLSND